MRMILALALTMAAGPAAVRAADAPKEAAPKLRTTFLPIPEPDQLERCGAKDFYYDQKLQGGSIGYVKYIRPAKPGEDPDRPIIDAVLNEDIRISPFIVTFLYKFTDYYHRRAEVQTKFEAVIAAKTEGAKRIQAEENYAMVLVYLGEFSKVIARYAPGTKDGGPWAQDGVVNYGLGNAYFRLGRYQEAVDASRKAHDLLAKTNSSSARDTRWQFMMSTLALYGKDFYKHFTCPDCSIEHIKRLFPNQDAAKLPFEDVTEAMKLERWGGYGDMAFVDLDADGWDDLVWARKYMETKIYRNLKGLSFEAIPSENLGNRLCNQLYFYPGDYDNDGKTDMLRNCCNYDGPGGLSLWKNMGGLKFKETSEAAGLGGASGEFTNQAWADYDLDGNLDFVVNDRGFGKSRLFRGNGDGTFTETTAAAGIDTPIEPPAEGVQWQTPGFGMGASWGDYDGDGFPDVFLQGWGWKRLYRNKGDGTFEDATKTSGIPDGKNQQGYYNFFFDYDNDGKLDIMAGGYTAVSEGSFSLKPSCLCSNILSPTGITLQEQAGAPELYHNNGDGTFTPMGEKIPFIPFGIMGYSHGDWNNSGHQSLVFGGGGPYFQQAEPYLFYQNNGDGTFTNITPYTTASLWGKGHSIAFGDYDHDGNLDLALNNGGFEPGDMWPSLLLHNTGGKNHFVEIHLKAGPGTNKSAIGARVSVRAGKLRQLQEVASGTGFGANSLSLHFGLAKNRRIDEIVVQWPNRRMGKTVLKNVPADQAIEIDEATGKATMLWAPERKALKPAR